MSDLELVDKLFAQIKCEHYSTALEIAAQGLHEHPGDPWWEYRYAEGLRMLGRTAMALDLLLQVHPRKRTNRHLVEMSLGQTYESRGDFESAEKWFREATVSNSSSTAPWVIFGSFLRRRDRLAEAFDALRNGL